MNQFGILDVYYYDLPWERIADQYGNISRDEYSEWSEDLVFIYWLLTLI